MSKQQTTIIEALAASAYTDPEIFRQEMEDWERNMIQHHASTTFAEDQEIINSVQQGLGSRGYETGPLMIDSDRSQYSEHAVAAIQQFWRDAMGDQYE